MDTVQEQPAMPRVIGIPFTAENARLMALRSVEARKQRKDHPQPSAVQPSADTLATLDDYQAKTIVRVRERMDKLLDLLEEEEDPNKLDRLASAFAKLQEEERKLAGRPLPGSHRPSSKPAKRSTPESYGPVE